MELSNKVYDGLKWFVLIFMPALAVLVGELGQVWAWPLVEDWIKVINLMTVFLGSILQISSMNYHGGSGKGLKTREGVSYG
ncbi:phage holin [Eremococcus coleocola]|uniref:phage holin n=1 Tax=Eremococcus coleocola TaxID=88132 RepID=UPI0003FA4A38|nr:phage holin [Eremococcus coleocola]